MIALPLAPAGPNTKAKAGRPLAQFFRAAKKMLLDDEDAAPAAERKKRSGGTGDMFHMAAWNFTVRARALFRAAKAMVLQGRQPAAAPAAFVPFGPPGDPFAPMWQQPYIENHWALAGNFVEDLPPAAGPSANL
jgi:hypothetical protein